MNIAKLKRKTYPEKKAVKVWKVSNWLNREFVCSIFEVKKEPLPSHYCGYVRFEKPLFNEYWIKKTGLSKTRMKKLMKELRKEEDFRIQEIVRDKQRTIRTTNYGGFITYIPVHGGITFAEKDEHGVVYGFDCAHAHDDENPKTIDMAWLTKECEYLGKALLSCKPYKNKYDRAKNREEKAIIIEEFREKYPNEHDLGFGVMVNLLSGKL